MIFNNLYKKIFIILIFLFVLIAFSIVVTADPIKKYRTYESETPEAPSSYWCEETYIYVTHGDAGSGFSNCKAYMKFDISDIPSFATISYANLYFYILGWFDAGPNSMTIYVIRVTEDWDECVDTTNPSVNASAPSQNTFSGTGWKNLNVKNEVKMLVKGTVTNYGFALGENPPYQDDVAVILSAHNPLTTYKPYLWIEVTLDNYTTTPESSNIEETTFTANGYVNYMNTSSTCGFWIGNVSNLYEETMWKNITATGTKGTGDSFTGSVSGLVPGEYYYVRSWVYNGAHFYNSSDLNYTLTKPNKPTNLEVTHTNLTDITLTWSNSTAGSAVDQKTMIRYKEGSYPTSPTDGSLGYNGTAETCKVSGLNPDTKYYFSAWTYVGASGSPFLWWFSDSYDTDYGETEGGNFSVTIRWECDQTLMDIDYGFNHSTITAETIDGQILYENTNPTTNPIIMVVPNGTDIIRFNYNDTGMYRSIIPYGTEKNYTIYVCCYGKWDDLDEYANYSWYQFPYTFTFLDEYPDSRYINNPYSHIDIYKWNDTGKFYVHQDYFDAQDSVEVYLHYGERFYIGVSNPSYSLNFIQYIDTGLDTEKEIRIITEENNTRLIEAYIYIESSRTTPGLWVNYSDLVYMTNAVNLSIYHAFPNNDTQILMWQYNFSSDTEDYLWTVGNGYNASHFYYIYFNINHSLFSPTNQTYSFFSFAFPYTPAINPNWFNNLFNQYVMDIQTTLGISPSLLLLFIFSFIMLIAVGVYWASAGFIASGAMLCIGLTTLFNEDPVITFRGIALGITMIIIGLLFARSDFSQGGIK